jgi:hypothetical protein
MRRAIFFPYTFVLLNWAAVVSLFCFLRRRGKHLREIWALSSQHQCRQEQANGSAVRARKEAPWLRS